jgi:hypothetical protein
MRLFVAMLLALVSACNGLSDADEASVSTSIMILAAVVPESNCSTSESGKRLARGIFDLNGVGPANSVGREYISNLIIRDQTQSGVGSKRLVVSYDFSANLIAPTAATRSQLRQQLTVPSGGWTQGTAAAKQLMVIGHVIPEHVTKILANDANIYAEIGRDDYTMNHVAGLPGYYTVQITVQALSLGLNGQWLRSPPYFLTVDLCDGCLTRRPEQLAFDKGDSVCRSHQDEIWVKLMYPPFPNLSATTKGAVNEGDAQMPLFIENSGAAQTLGSRAARRSGRSKAGVWLISPNHRGKDDFPFAGLAVPERNAFGECGAGNILPGETEDCLVPSYPRFCEVSGQACVSTDDCGDDDNCLTSSNLLVAAGDAGFVSAHCGTPTETPQQGGGDAGPGSDGGPPPPPPDGGTPIVSCLYIVCADVDNEVLEWNTDGVSWESDQSNCTCYSEDSELAENGCPL